MTFAARVAFARELLALAELLGQVAELEAAYALPAYQGRS